jgi:adenosine 3'-phospho 5'-phosphosulfate transporter B3
MAFAGAMVLMELLIEGFQKNVKGLDPPTFGFTITLTQFFGCFIVGKACGGALLPNRDKTWLRTFLPYVLLSFLIFCGTCLANIAVGYVQYPVKIVFKSSKLVPVMVVSTLMRNSRSYAWKDYCAAVLICAGTAGFAWDAGKSDVVPAMVCFGIALLVAAILADALSVNTQQKMMQCQDVDPNTMMTRLNFVGLLGVVLFQGASGQLSTLMASTRADPRLVAYLFGIGSTLGMAVWAYTHLINEAGSVFAVGVATLRKMITVVLSYVVFPKSFTWLHVTAALLTFLGLILSEVDSKRLTAQDADEARPLASSEEGLAKV